MGYGYIVAPSGYSTYICVYYSIICIIYIIRYVHLGQICIYRPFDMYIHAWLWNKQWKIGIRFTQYTTFNVLFIGFTLLSSLWAISASDSVVMARTLMRILYVHIWYILRT